MFSTLMNTQIDFAAFGKGVQLNGESTYAETEQLFRLTSPSGIFAPHDDK